MIICVMGKCSVISDLGSKNSIHLFKFIDEVIKVEKSPDLLVNGVKMSVVDAVILTNHNQIYNFIWSELSGIPFFSPPFDAEAASNHHYYFAISNALGLKQLESNPRFKEKITVRREFPRSCKEIQILMFGTESIPIKGVASFKPGILRKLRKLINVLGVKVALINLMIDSDGEVFIKELNPFPIWDEMPLSAVKSYLDWVIHTSGIIKGKRY